MKIDRLYVASRELIFAACFTIAGASGAAVAQEIGFDPRQKCSDILQGTGDINRALAASWTYGFLAAKQDDPSPVDVPNMDVMLRNLDRVCLQNPTISLLSLVDKSKKPGADVPGSEANARVMLEKFLVPGADLVMLTAEILPSEADIRAVYRDPLASKMVQVYRENLVPGVKFGPKPDQDSLVTTRATTSQLVNRDAVLRDFPGGYEQVLEYMNPDFPILRFKFVKSGETAGLAFDGLIYVNDHWVIMPKPWRILE